MYQYIPLTLAANEVRPVAAYGRYLRILDNSLNGTKDPAVRIGTQTEQTLPAGVGIDLNSANSSQDPNNFFAQLVVRNTSSTTQMVLNIAINDSPVDDSRLQLTALVSTKDVNSDSILAQITAAAASLVTLVAQGVAVAASWVTALANLLKIQNNTRSLNGDTGSPVQAYGEAMNATVTVYTVTTGKTLYLTAFNLSHMSDSSVSFTKLQIFNASAVLVTTLMKVENQTSVGGGSGFCQSLPTPYKVSSQYTIKVVTTADVAGASSIFGWEE